MKFHFILFLLTFPFCLLSGCSHSTCDGMVSPTYYLSNQSGHDIAIVHFPSCDAFPDSLLLKVAEEFELQGGLSPFRNIKDSKFVKQYIYYDGRYRLDLKDLPCDRQLQDISLYLSKTYPIYVFILTENDYNYAVEHGTDLGPR